VSAIFTVHYITDAAEGDYQSDVELDGPSHTRCAGMLVYQSAVRDDSSAGPLTLYIGPGVEEIYPWLDTAFDPATEGRYDATPLQHWCPGTYLGKIWGPEIGLWAVVEGTFRLVVSATRHTTGGGRPMREAHHLRPVTVSPVTGRSATIFTVRSIVDPSATGPSGDIVQVSGPRRTPCAGIDVRDIAARNDSRRGPITLHIGPGASRKYPYYPTAQTAYDPLSPSGNHTPLRRWCPGTYTGKIILENNTTFTLEARFQFAVTRHEAG
jgi:hypothetical protein